MVKTIKNDLLEFYLLNAHCKDRLYAKRNYLTIRAIVDVFSHVFRSFIQPHVTDFTINC
jgi:hypothetical protein